MNTGHKVLIGVAAVVLAVAVAVGGWQGGWWLNKNAVNRSGKISNTSFARQNALRIDALDKQRSISDIDVQMTEATDTQKPVLAAQRKAIVAQFCDDVAQMTTAQTPAAIAATASQECK